MLNTSEKRKNKAWSVRSPLLLFTKMHSQTYKVHHILRLICQYLEQCSIYLHILPKGQAQKVDTAFPMWGAETRLSSLLLVLSFLLPTKGCIAVRAHFVVMISENPSKSFSESLFSEIVSLILLPKRSTLLLAAFKDILLVLGR